MARKRMVTRTVIENVYTVKTVNTDTDVIANVDIQVSAALPEKKQLQALAGELAKQGLALVKILAQNKRETLYGMEESQFIHLAVKLPPRSRVHPEPGLVEIDD